VRVKLHRGFESHPLRYPIEDRRLLELLREGFSRGSDLLLLDDYGAVPETPIDFGAVKFVAVTVNVPARFPAA
jgi:hypothetical protein